MKKTKAQLEANKRYLAKYPEKKETFNKSRYKSTCKRYIREFSTKEDIEELEQLIETRKQQLNTEVNK